MDFSLTFFTLLIVLRRWTRCCFVIYSTRRFVVCLSVCHFVLVFFSPFSIAITSLGEERANLSAIRTFVRFVLVWICRFPIPLGVWEELRFVIVALPGLFSYFFFFFFFFFFFLRLPRLGKRELILVLFVRLFDLRMFGFVCSSSSCCLGRVAVCDCGTPWTFLLPFFFFFFFYLVTIDKCKNKMKVKFSSHIFSKLFSYPFLIFFNDIWSL